MYIEWESFVLAELPKGKDETVRVDEGDDVLRSLDVLRKIALPSRGSSPLAYHANRSVVDRSNWKKRRGKGKLAAHFLFFFHSPPSSTSTSEPLNAINHLYLK